MNRQTLLKHDNYIIMQHSHYPPMKIYRKNSLTTYHIQKLLAYQKAFDLTDMFFHNYSFHVAQTKITFKRVPDTYSEIRQLKS